jgi:O-succinylhomoserine sulfhydrylase
VKTTITHPTTTTHSRLSDQERIEVGINDNLVRIAVGLEDIDDIIGDLNYLLK